MYGGVEHAAHVLVERDELGVHAHRAECGFEVLVVCHGCFASFLALSGPVLAAAEGEQAQQRAPDARFGALPHRALADTLQRGKLCGLDVLGEADARHALRAGGLQLLRGQAVHAVQHQRHVGQRIAEGRKGRQIDAGAALYVRSAQGRCEAVRARARGELRGLFGRDAAGQLGGGAQAQRVQRHEEMFSCLDAGEQAQLLALLEKLNRDWQSRFRDGQEGRGAVR